VDSGVKAAVAVCNQEVQQLSVSSRAIRLKQSDGALEHPPDTLEDAYVPEEKRPLIYPVCLQAHEPIERDHAA